MRELLGLSIFASFAIIFTVVTVVLVSPSITGDFTHSGMYLQYSTGEACEMFGDCEFSRYITSLAQAAPYNQPMVECVCADGSVQYAQLKRPVVGLAK